MEIYILTILILVFSAVFHEFFHGYIAYKLGDNTAKFLGRLTLNPIPHLDLVGSIIVPFLLIISKADFIIGWAKPVPYNPNNLSDFKYGDAKVAAAGPLSNLFLAVCFGLLARLLPINLNEKITIINGFFTGQHDAILAMMHGSLAASLYTISIIFCFLNIALALFNLVPIPPLDGSKILATFLPAKMSINYMSLGKYGMFIILLLVIMGGFSILWTPIITIFSFLTGIS